MKKFEFLKHTGDVKFRANGQDIEQMFENVSLAISNLFSRGQKIKSSNKKELSVSGKDYESLLYNFIEELIYLFDAENFIVSKSSVKISKFKIKAIVYGDSSSNYEDLDAIKSPTYAEMYVRNEDGKWGCQVVVDV